MTRCQDDIVENTPQGSPDSDESGATMVEYALLVALVALTCIITLFQIGQVISDQFENVSEQVQ